MDNFLESYLIRVGAAPDEYSFRKLKGVMELAEANVVSHTSGIAKTLLEAQASIGGAFLSLSGTILGVVENASKMDQQFRLTGLRLMMSQDQARKMDMITKSLGASLEEIVWDQELHQRAVVMAEDIDRMSAGLGSGFEGGMKSIRDFRFEFQRLGVGVQFLGFQFANDLWTKLNPGAAGKTVHDWVDWFEEQIPHFSDKLTNYAVPALRKTWEMALEFGQVLKGGAVAWTNLIGLLSGDTSIQGTAFSFDKLAKSIEHVGDWMIKFFLWMTHAEASLLHFATGIELLFEKKWTAAGREFKEGWAVLTSPLPQPAAPKRYGLEGREMYKDLALTPDYIESRAQYGTNDDLVTKLAAAIIRKEGSAVEGTVGFRNNNPGNLRNWEGFPTSEGYAKFPDWDTGLEKLKKQIRTNMAKGLTLDEFFAGKPDVYGGYAPTNDNNDPQRYAADVSKWTGIPQNVPLNQMDQEKVAPKPMWEGGNQGYFDSLKTEKEGGGIFSSDDPRDWLKSVIDKLPNYTHEFADVIKNALTEGVSSWASSAWDHLSDPTKPPRDRYGNLINQEQSRFRGPILGDTLFGDKAFPDKQNSLWNRLRFDWKDLSKPIWDQFSLKPITSPKTTHLMGPMPATPPVADKPVPATGPSAWLQMPADDTKPRDTVANMAMPDWYSTPIAPERDWSPVISAMNQPIIPAANVSHVQQHISFGDIIIPITQPGADAETIARVVEQKLTEHTSRQILSDLAQLNPAYASA